MTTETKVRCECGHHEGRHWGLKGHCFAMACAIDEALWLDLFTKPSSEEREAEAANSRCQSFRPAGATS